MMYINDFENIGFKISWTLLSIGYMSNSVFSDQLSSKDIIDYATRMLADNADVEIEVLKLACEYEANNEDIKKWLILLAKKEHTDYNLEYEKWVVLYVLSNLPDERLGYMQGLIELGDIWSFLDYPSDSPHIFQGRGNDITPQDFYTLENYVFLLHQHKTWLQKKISHIEAMSR